MHSLCPCCNHWFEKVQPKKRTQPPIIRKLIERKKRKKDYQQKNKLF